MLPMLFGQSAFTKSLRPIPFGSLNRLGTFGRAFCDVLWSRPYWVTLVALFWDSLVPSIGEFPRSFLGATVVLRR